MYEHSIPSNRSERGFDRFGQSSPFAVLSGRARSPLSGTSVSATNPRDLLLFTSLSRELKSPGSLSAL